MTGALMPGALMPLAGEVVLAHHMIIAAIPFLVPTAVITTMVAVMAVRDRHRGEDDQDRNRAHYGEPGRTPGEPGRTPDEDQRPG
ncbi:MAG TPA: hypothetical protein VGJ13_20360 [Pseudonocardiaceae bacterium]